MVPSVSALVSDLERKVEQLDAAAMAATDRGDRYLTVARIASRRATEVYDDADRAERVAARIRELIG